MKKNNRHQRLVDLLKNGSSIVISDIAKKFDVSEITIRRDLNELEREGIISKFQNEKYRLLDSRNLPILNRIYEEIDAKELIAQAASKLINDNQSIFVGSGSTTFCLAKYLINKKNLTVVTNALNLGFELAWGKDLTIVVVGGVLRSSELSLIGHISQMSLKEIFVHKVFIGMAAISLDAGLTNDYLPEVATDREIFNLNSEIILLADHTKIGKVASAFVAPIEKINTLITDELADKNFVKELQNRGVNVIIAHSGITGKGDTN
ncbi:MAG: DeoR/GlpR transcriptional regulator [Clostridiaceae bacterium]|nr:DeoR/GlpR transcriptional regulator [Clostridiaceae bacterium]